MRSVFPRAGLPFSISMMFLSAAGFMAYSLPYFILMIQAIDYVP